MAPCILYLDIAEGEGLASCPGRFITRKTTFLPLYWLDMMLGGPHSMH
jgi:hypothetical protein